MFINRKKYEAIVAEIVRLKNHIAGLENDFQLFKQEVRIDKKSNSKGKRK